MSITSSAGSASLCANHPACRNTISENTPYDPDLYELSGKIYCETCKKTIFEAAVTDSRGGDDKQSLINKARVATRPRDLLAYEQHESQEAVAKAIAEKAHSV